MKKNIYVYEECAVISKAGAQIHVHIHDQLIYNEPFSNIESFFLVIFRRNHVIFMRNLSYWSSRKSIKMTVQKKNLGHHNFIRFYELGQKFFFSYDSMRWVKNFKI